MTDTPCQLSTCTLCNSEAKQLKRTLYGEYLCEECWDTYLDTDHGKAEYLIEICAGNRSPEEFDADFLCDVLMSWKLNFSRIKLSPQDKYIIEQKIKTYQY